MTYVNEFLNNQLLMSGIIGWLVAQFLKTVIDIALNQSFNPERLVGSGGMPSSHSSTMCALTTAAFIKYGAGSFEFAIRGHEGQPVLPRQIHCPRRPDTGAPAKPEKLTRKPDRFTGAGHCQAANRASTSGQNFEGIIGLISKDQQGKGAGF